MPLPSPEELRALGLTASTSGAVAELGTRLLLDQSGPPRRVRFALIQAALQWQWTQPEYRPAVVYLHVFIALLDMAKGQAGAVWIIHILRSGVALCGMPGAPSEWPSGHRWVSEGSPLVNCVRCRDLGGTVDAK